MRRWSRCLPADTVRGISSGRGRACGAGGRTRWAGRAVGEVMLEILEERKSPVKNSRLLASERSVGKRLAFRGEQVPVELLQKSAFKGIDIALFSAGASPGKGVAGAAGGSGAGGGGNSPP